MEKCDICQGIAQYDAKTVLGPWAFLCQQCFNEMGVGLGVGKGQMLTKEHPMPDNIPDEMRVSKIQIPGLGPCNYTGD